MIPQAYLFCDRLLDKLTLSGGIIGGLMSTIALGKFTTTYNQEIIINKLL